MARLPNEIIVKSRIQAGYTRQKAEGTYVNAPRQISPPMLQPRSVPAPYQNAPVDKVGPVITQKAVNQFGEILVSATAYVADRQARLIAEEKLDDGYYAMLGYLKGTDQEIGYLHLKGQEAVEGYKPFQDSILQIEKDILDTTPNHAKTYLIPKIESMKKQFLQMAANHSQKQYTVWGQNVEKNKLSRFQEQLKGAAQLPMKDVWNMIQQSTDERTFANDLERQAYVDNAINIFTEYTGSRVVIQNEDYNSDAPLLSRLQAYSDRVDKINKYASTEQRTRNNQLRYHVNSQVAAELNKREIKRKNEFTQEQEKVLDRIYGFVATGNPVPVYLLEMASTSRLLGPRDFMKIEADTLAEQRRTKALKEVMEDYEYPKTPNFNALSTLSDMFAEGKSYSEIGSYLLQAYENKWLRVEDYTAAFSRLQNRNDKQYNDALNYLQKEGIRLIQTTGAMAEYVNKDEKYRLQEFDRKTLSALNKAKAEKDLSWERILQIQYSLEAQYPPHIMLATLAPLPLPKHPEVQRPRSFFEYDMAARLMQDEMATMTEEEKINAGHLLTRYRYYINLYQQKPEEVKTTRGNRSYRGR